MTLASMDSSTSKRLSGDNVPRVLIQQLTTMSGGRT